MEITIGKEIRIEELKEKYEKAQKIIILLVAVIQKNI